MGYARIKRSFLAFYQWFRELFMTRFGRSRRCNGGYMDTTRHVSGLGPDCPLWSLTPPVIIPTQECCCLNRQRKAKSPWRIRRATPIYLSCRMCGSTSGPMMTNLPIPCKGPWSGRIRVTRFELVSVLPNPHQRGRSIAWENLAQRRSTAAYSDLDAYSVCESCCASDEDIPIGQLSFAGPLTSHVASSKPKFDRRPASQFRNVVDPKLVAASEEPAHNDNVLAEKADVDDLVGHTAEIDVQKVLAERRLYRSQRALD